MMENKRLILGFWFLLIGVLLSSFVIGVDSIIGVGGGVGGSNDFTNPTNNWQSYEPSFNQIYSSADLSTYWPILKNIENDQCEATTDFIVSIRPGSCTPMVVRSDLLEEQNVPVFCQLDAVRINPLIKVSSIKSISFKSAKPEGVLDIAFHPSRAAINSYKTPLGSQLLNNIGYVVIILKQNTKENEMPEWIAGNITATIYYDADNAYGVGKSDYYLPAMSDEDWERDYVENSFWYGKGFLRVKGVSDGVARVALYTDKNNVFREFDLKEGQTTNEIYFPGFYCKAGLKVKLNKVVSPEDQVKLNIDGDTIWVREGTSILNNACRVSDVIVNKDGVTGSIKISCPGQKLNLIVQGFDASISVNDADAGKYKLGSLVTPGIFGIGDKAVGSEDTEWYLGYSGLVPSNVKGLNSDGSENEFILLIDSKDELTAEELGAISKGVKEVSKLGDLNKDKFLEKIKSSSKLNKKNFILGYKGSEFEIGGKDIVFNGFSKGEEGGNQFNQGGLVTEYFDKGKVVVNELVDNLPRAEKENEETYGEEALFEQIKLAEKIGDQKSRIELLRKFLETYPDSDRKTEIKKELGSAGAFDFSKAYSNVFVNNDYHSISVDEFKSVQEGEKKATVRVGTTSYKDSKEDDKINLGSGKGHLIIKDIQPGSVSFQYYNKESVKGQLYSINEDDSKEIEEVNVIVDDIDVKEIAYVSLIPNLKSTSTEASFTFKIGIEKRNIKLSPEKTKEMIKNINETVARWEEINKKLGNLIKVWKGACFATSTILMIKSSFEGFSGEGLARSEVMKYYRQKCDTLVKEGKYASRSQCYADKSISSAIDGDVKSMTTAIQNVNKKMDSSLKGYQTTSGLFGLDSTVTDNKGYLNALKSQAGGGVVSVKGPDGQVVQYDIGKATSSEQVRGVLFLKELESLGASESLKKMAQEEIDASWRSVWIKEKSDSLRNTYQSSHPEIEGDLIDLRKDVKYWGLSGDNVVGETLRGKLTKVDSSVEIPDNAKYQVITYTDGKPYLVVLTPSQGTNLDIVGVYEVVSSGYSRDGNVKKVESELKSKHQFINGGSCNNYFKSPEVKYYESGGNKGLPAIVPFDLKEGWYAVVPNSMKTNIDGVQGYQASGDVSYWKVCNVGPDHLENQGKYPDDLCQTFDVNNYNKVDKFLPCPNLGRDKVQELAQKSRQAIREAAQQYGKSSVRILGQDMGAPGLPVSDYGDIECQDFMSPEDCKLMFNVCDPVICPASRCDLGGKMPVADVIQTGIIGSIFLCLPNAKEGIIVPVCLTGIHAGLESYVSILNSELQCLQRSLDNGEHIGICDEITSIYMCEFFWRQIAPVFDIIIPKMIESAYGLQGVRGGGEYLTVMHSWNNLQRSIDYFKGSYAQNAFKAFQYRNVEEIGTEFCKAFVGTSLPTNAKVLDSLLAPESPTQFYAWFSETAFTDATVPATSHYKVYYHIYAGEDKGVYYSVKLKDPPASGYYKTNQEVQVKRGYIGKGEEADEALDFTAPAGYKQLCVRIDNQEECGFKQVTTDFGLNYIRKKYVEEQAETKSITKEEECISGSPSLLPIVNPNVQAGVEEAVMPQISLRGIVRICATSNPAVGVDYEIKKAEDEIKKVTEREITQKETQADPRWKDVGYCGDPQMRCWLDTHSVDKDLKDVAAIEGKPVSELIQDDRLEGKRKTDDEVSGILSKLKERINGLKYSLDEKALALEVSGLKVYVESQIEDINKDLDGIINLEEGVGYNNQDRAQAYSFKAWVYRVVVEQLVKMGVKEVTPAPAPSEVVSPPVVVDDAEPLVDKPEGFYLNGEDIWYRNLQGIEKDTGFNLVQTRDSNLWGIKQGDAQVPVAVVRDDGIIKINDFTISDISDDELRGYAVKLNNYKYVDSDGDNVREFVEESPTPNSV